jgi:hypothetical protein
MKDKKGLPTFKVTFPCFGVMLMSKKKRHVQISLQACAAPDQLQADMLTLNTDS